MRLCALTKSCTRSSIVGTNAMPCMPRKPSVPPAIGKTRFADESIHKFGSLWVNIVEILSDGETARQLRSTFKVGPEDLAMIRAVNFTSMSVVTPMPYENTVLYMMHSDCKHHVIYKV
jgi:hypothetical protein